MDAHALQLLAGAITPDDGYLDLDETKVQEIMNFDCGLCPAQTQDECWKTIADEYEEDDGDSL